LTRFVLPRSAIKAGLDEPSVVRDHGPFADRALPDDGALADRHLANRSLLIDRLWVRQIGSASGSDQGKRRTRCNHNFPHGRSPLGWKSKEEQGSNLLAGPLKTRADHQARNATRVRQI
jgi:hypothetical protein